MVHGGLLGDRDLASHKDAMHNHGILSIDLLIVNLYPFEKAVADGGSYEMCVENIDIGGPAMIRAAAKNHAHVAVCTDAEDVDAVLADMDANDNQTSGTLRQNSRRKPMRAPPPMTPRLRIILPITWAIWPRLFARRRAA